MKDIVAAMDGRVEAPFLIEIFSENMKPLLGSLERENVKNQTSI
jgi:hypothetical protein